MQTITTREIASLFNTEHRKITRTIKGSPHKDLFTECSYTSSQNKEIACYSMGIDGLKLLLNRASFQRGEKMFISIELLESFGVSTDLKLYERKSSEESTFIDIKGRSHHSLLWTEKGRSLIHELINA